MAQSISRGFRGSRAQRVRAAIEMLERRVMLADNGVGLKGEYYDNSNMTGLVLTRTDATVNFNWGNLSPDASMGVDTFSVRWTGRVEPCYSETYTFYTRTDDGARLWVNNQLLVDKWINQGATEWSGTITLAADQRYDIKLEYYENTGGAVAELRWSSASQAKEIIPQSRLYYPAGENVPPTATITGPASGTSYVVGMPIELTATATHQEGIDRVEFYAGVTLLGSDDTAPYTLTWTGAQTGAHTVTARAVDVLGAVGVSSGVTVNVVAAPAPIYVNFQPTGSTVPTGYIQDNGRTYRSQNGLNYGWDVNLNDYAQPWADRNSANSPDQRFDTFIQMKDVDSHGNARAKWEIELPNGTYEVRVVSGDPSNSNKPEELYVEGVLAYKGYTSSTPTTALWFDATVPVLVTDGRLTLYTVSSYANLPVATHLNFIDIVPMNLPPHVALTSPADGTELIAPATIPITATASDFDGSVVRVDFYGDGNLIGSDTDGSDGYSLEWTDVAAGVRTMTATAVDDAGRMRSATATVRVVTAGNAPPTTSITSPTQNQQFNTTGTVNITINANAGDTDGSISKVEFFRSDPFMGVRKIGEDATSPYSITFSGAAPGTYTFWTRAWDNGFEVTDSAPVDVLVNKSPTVSISNPINGRVYSAAPADVRLTVTATDSDGTIENVKFYMGRTLLFTDTEAPYEYVIPGGLPPGTYNFKASATDNSGSTITTGVNTITVVDGSAVLDSSSWLGGSGTDYVKEAEIQADGTVVLAAVITDAAPGGLSPILLNGATAATAGAIVRLSPDGKTVLSVTRLANEIGDMSLDAAGNIYVAARTQGIIKLNPTATRVLWTRLNDGDGVNNPGNGTADRLDAAADGTIAVLRDAQEYAGTGGSKIIFVYNPDGTYRGTVTGKYNRVYDVAIDGTTQSVFVTGFNQATGPSGNPVQIAYLKSAAYDGTQKWMDYDWTATQVDDPASGGTGPTNNMADTRGLRVSMGRDGKLYTLFMAAGGNHIFRYDPHDIFTTGSIVGGDSYHQMYNTQSQHKTFFGRYDPATGDILLGQQFVSRTTSTVANTFWGEKGNIKADEAGRVYFSAASATYPPYTFNPVPDTEYGAGPSFVIMSADLTTRLFVGRVNSSGYPHTIAARILDGQTYPNVVFGGYTTGPTNWTKDALQALPGGGQDGFFAVREGMLLGATATIMDNGDASGVTIGGSWTSATSGSDYGANYIHDNNTGKGASKYVQFTPTISAAGVYQVYAWWVSGSDRSAATPIDVTYSNGAGGTNTTTVTVDQTLNGGKWVLLGVYRFDAGTAGRIKIRTDGTSGRVVVDAVRLVPVDYLSPGAPANLRVSDVSGSQITLAWDDLSSGESGFQVERSPDGVTFTAVGTVGANVTVFTDTTSVADGVYSYRVRALAGTTFSATSGQIVVMNGASGASPYIVRRDATRFDVQVFAGVPSSGDDTLAVTASLVSDLFLRTGAFTVENDLGLVSLNVGHGASATLLAGQSLSELAVTGNGRLDILSHFIEVSYGGVSPLAAIEAWIASGYSGGAWTGDGIRSSLAAAAGDTAVGYNDNGSRVLLKYTYYGDVDLDGIVNFTDLLALSQNYNGLGGWARGDFDFSGGVNFADLLRLSQNYNRVLA